ncbi:serine hydrolase domain-containing protein [Sphingobium algorifonticola]|uniref:Class A beta-lactamase-related serine hydrolase n=1 Tax=Sphingobium algorifonticola TaxID=2008318 RepID=A0A437J5Q4_9SPHN|nr:serine hydrolase domain-containing protein [Sphingobium algorifonticola]RVT40265.1 class A beta-lactamase-related serine hydrolase [Sphingobium algorifonticola]
MRLPFLVLAFAIATTPAYARQSSIDAALDTAVAETQRTHPELPSISLSILSPRHGIDWTGISGSLTQKGTPLKSPPAFRIASVTKVFVAAAVLKLIEDGRFAVTDPITRLISAETAAQLRQDGYSPDDIIVRHLLEHSSGIFNYANGSFAAQVVKEPGHIWTRREQIAFAMTQGDPVNRPGEAFHYSDTGYIILGEIIERATGEALPQAVRRLNKFAALGIGHSWFETAEPLPDGAPAIAHQYLAGTDMAGHHPSFDLFGGGGIVSTTRDLARYFRALSLGSVFDRRETLALALIAPDVPRQAGEMPHAPLMMVYPLGKHRCWGHGGFFGTWAMYCPDIDTAIAVAVNANTGGRNDGIKDMLNRVDSVLAESGIR